MTAAELDLDAIEARANAATEGPWKAVHFEDDGFPQTAHGVWGQAEDECIFEDVDTLLTDAEFIAAARTDVPALVAEVRRLRTELANARRQAVEAVIADRTAQSTDPEVARAGAFKLEQSLRPWFGPRCISDTAMHRVAADVLRSTAWVRPAALGCNCVATGGAGLSPTQSREHADDCPAVTP